MSALILASIIFVLTLSGIVLGTLLRRSLPEHHLDEHTKDVVRLGVGLIATIAALVLGLLIAAAKELVRYADRSTQADHRRSNPARQHSGSVWTRSSSHPPTNTQHSR